MLEPRIELFPTASSTMWADQWRLLDGKVLWPAVLDEVVPHPIDILIRR
jgi:hypothetical protein